MPTLEERQLRRVERIKTVRDLAKIPVVKVMPTSDKVRKWVAHMPGRIKFPAEGPAKWPLDNFTKRRLRDGDITIVEEAEGGAPKQIESKPRKSHAWER